MSAMTLEEEAQLQADYDVVRLHLESEASQLVGLLEGHPLRIEAALAAQTVRSTLRELEDLRRALVSAEEALL